jgi:hypothetical protein
MVDNWFYARDNYPALFEFSNSLTIRLRSQPFVLRPAIVVRLEMSLPGFSAPRRIDHEYRTGAATEGATSDGKEAKGRQEIDLETVHQEEDGQKVDQKALDQEEGHEAVG